MEKQNHEIKGPAEMVRETVPANNTPKAEQYAEWLKAILSVPRYCRHHPHSRLVSGVGKRQIGPSWLMSVENEFERTFRANFFCSVCAVQYARYPQEFINTSFDTFLTNTKERATALALARRFAELVNQTGVGFFLLSGMPGTGKTRLSANIVGELVGIPALYARHGELINALRATYGGDKYEYDREGRKTLAKTPLQIAQSTPLLVLDEIGCTSPANDERMFFDELIKHRFDHRKPTILITNLPLKDLKIVLGDAIADRIEQATGNGKFIFIFTGESYRRGAGGEYLQSSDG